MMKRMLRHIMKYRKIIMSIQFFILILLSSVNCKTETQQATNNQQATNKLLIPQLIDSRESNRDIQITIQNGQHEFYPNVKSHTKGFNGSYLGPTIRLYKNDSTRIRFTNKIGEATTVHGHGLHVEGKVDGGPHSKILPDQTWDITLPIKQEASTNWYHPHLMGKTAEHVHAGLAGLYLVEDENSLALPLPKTYGVDDIPLIIQDRDFTDGKMTDYNPTIIESIYGKRGKTLVVNGTIDPYIIVPKGWVRLRLLNGSNARIYNFYLKDKQSFYKIATEGGFLEKPIAITDLTMAPGERNEIMIDMSDGQSRELLATTIFQGLQRDSPELTNKRVLEIRVDSTKVSNGKLPSRLNTIHRWKKENASITRTFVLGTFRDSLAINGKPMDMAVINEEVRKGDIEVWRIRGGEMVQHPFHMHGTSFLILSQDGRPPKPEDRGWKDVVTVYRDWTEVIMKFNFEATKKFPYMYHCHILEHEDRGMMGQFTVE